jgi:signal transduction histidine kinase
MTFMLIPVSIGLATIRYRLWEIDPLINRTLVYGGLTAGVVGIYILVVGSFSLLFQTSQNFLISLLATGLVAVLFQPLREQLQRGINHLLYGERSEPYAVLARLGERLEVTLAPEAVLPAFVETVAQALKLPYVAIALAPEDVKAGDGTPEVQNQVVAAVGTPAGEIIRLPLTYQGEVVGQMRLAPRAPGETFSSADQRLLALLARQAGVATHAVRLTTHLQHLTVDLQHSREQLILAREEERRRLRRDLHDGIGPTLASLSQRLDTARRLVPADPETATVLLDDLKTQVRSTIADIRRLVYALRPPVLDEFGLLSAIREQAANYNQPNGLRVVIEAPEQLPPLPAAVEVAAYRIIMEALTNAVRHGQAEHCLVRLWLADESLALEVTDDGRGLPVDFRAGVGMTSMRERATELGGEFHVGPVIPQGTCISVRLPLPKE